MDASLLQGLGALLGGTAAMAAFIAGVINRSKISSFLNDRFVLVESAAEANKRAAAAERLANEYERSVKAMEVSLREIEKRVTRLEIIEKKFQALVEWVGKVLEYIVFLERRAASAGIDLSARTMPPMPPSLSSDIEIPEDIRGH